jgi:hypothetical protein
MKTIKKKCDDLWGKLVRARGRCERCGKTTNLQAAHIISRSHGKTRHLLENGVCLDAGCHIFWGHKNPDEFVDFIRETRGQDIYERLREIANGSEKPDYEKAYQILKEAEKLGRFI